jgi:hypothetical protein
MGGISGTVLMMNLEKQVAMSEDRRDAEARTKDARLDAKHRSSGSAGLQIGGSATGCVP